MLLNFRVANFRSFKDEVSVSFLATRLDEGYGFPAQVAQDGSTVDVLPVIAVLGANASGKSNLLRAMAFMREMVLESATRSRRSSPLGNPFVLDAAWADKPTLLEIDFVMDNARYQYGFELHRGKFTDEWLQTYPHKRSQTLFDREHSTEFTFGKGLHGQNRTIAEITRNDVLFLSSAAQAGHNVLTPIYNFFENSLLLLDVPQRSEASPPMIRRLAQRHSKAVKLLALADLGIVDARVKQEDVAPEEREAMRELLRHQYMADLPEGPERENRVEEFLSGFFLSQQTVELLHRTNRNAIPLPFDEESLGTKSWLSFVSYTLDALDTGGTLLVDELDASLHPLLIAEALRLYQDPGTNTHGAQLIFTTHDVTLLDNSFEKFRLSRGQVWLTEKGEDGSSVLTPLSDYRPRKGEDIARGYLQGRYGGTPHIGRRGGNMLTTKA